MGKRVKIGDVVFGGKAPLGLIAGPCVIEGRKACVALAGRLVELARDEGIPFIFNAFFSLVISLLACTPLIIKRTYFEEKNSLEIFGSDYRQYRETTWAFWPMKKGIRK